jgi:cytoskeletal protein RodZ
MIKGGNEKESSLMYSRIAEARRKKNKHLFLSMFGLTLSVAIISFLVFNLKNYSETFTIRAEADVIKTSESTNQISSKSDQENLEVSASTEPEITEQVEPEIAIVSEVHETLPDDTTALTIESSTAATATVAYTPNQTTPTLSNGNTAGTIGMAAAAQMAAATGVAQSVWEAIIARESNGDPTVSNTSGASGLFQTMPGWGTTATVQDQINAAINAYNAQGMSAWGY